MAGVISTPHTLATEAGMQMFRAGGNAVDAALAAAAVLTVVYPHQCALGGDAFALVESASGDVTAYNGSGAAPAGLDADLLRARYDGIPDAGPLSISVPGLVAAWHSLSSSQGTLPWAELLAPAIALADDGVAVSRSLAAGILYRQGAMNRALRELLLPGDRPLAEGECFAQPALADTLRILAEEGADSFYRGSLSQRIVRGLNAEGCPISSEDLASHQTALDDALSLHYDGVEFLCCPPNSQGFVLLEALASLDALGLPLDARGEGARHLLQALLMAADDREALLGDPQRNPIDMAALFDRTALANRLSHAIQTGQAPAVNNPVAHGDTVAVCAMDDSGVSISLIQSVFQTFGSAVLEPETGIIFHNRARGFSLDPEAPNFLRAGCRPAHSLMPLLLRREGRVFASLGTMGGKAQPQILAQLLPGVMAGTASLEAVLATPRWVFGARDIDFPGPTVAIEADAPAELDQHLKIHGLDVARVPACSESVGHAQAVRRRADGELEGAADPRSDGNAGVCAD